MKTQGFTLIEIIVVMAIVAIMAGIMVPFVYKAWESTEIDTTKERMSALKKAMVGDKVLIQNGVRTDYGYVGDVGQLPADLDYLMMNKDSAVDWKGPYLGSGFDPKQFKEDAWNNPFVYSVTYDTSGRRVSATITSYGSDRAAGNTTGTTTAEDITLAIDVNEVIPTNNVQGNISISFSNAPQTVLNYSTKVIVKYKDGSGSGGLKQDSCGCGSITISGSSGNTQVIYPGFSFNCLTTEYLPVGLVKVQALLFSDSGCSTLKKNGEEIIFNVNDRMNSLNSNLQILSVTAP